MRCSHACISVCVVRFDTYEERLLWTVIQTGQKQPITYMHIIDTRNSQIKWYYNDYFCTLFQQVLAMSTQTMQLHGGIEHLSCQQETHCMGLLQISGQQAVCLPNSSQARRYGRADQTQINYILSQKHKVRARDFQLKNVMIIISFMLQVKLQKIVIFVIGKIKQPSSINSIQYLKTYNMLHDFLCLFVKKWNLQMYSIAKIHYTTITMNKEGVARFVLKIKKIKNKENCQGNLCPGQEKSGNFISECWQEPCSMCK